MLSHSTVRQPTAIDLEVTRTVVKHLENIGSSSPPNYTVRVFRAARADVPRPEVFWMNGWGEWERLFFYMVLVQGPNVNAIVNTGPPPDLEILNKGWREFAGSRCELVREESETPQRILQSVDLQLSDITHVLLTPLQLYATANIALFPNAQICMSRRGWVEDVTARLPWLHPSRKYCISDEVLKYIFFEASHRLRLLECEDEVCLGIRASWVGTHHRSSMLYSIDTANGTVGVSDCAFKYKNVEGHPLGIGESLEEGYIAYTRIRKEIRHFIPLYDPEVLVRYQDGVVA
jgi:glyoxylase-like metal-dependent hydrolase (beta-lactamase superfamily II)